MLINLTVRVDAYFHPIGMTYPIHPGPFSGQHQISESPLNTLFLKTLQKGQTSYSPLFNSSSIDSMRKAIKFMELLRLFSKTKGSLYELDEFNSPHTGTTRGPLQLWLCRLRRKIPLRQPAISSLGNIFWRHSCFSPQTTRTTHSWATTSFLSLTSKHDHCYTYGDYTSLTHSTMP